jgi:hypothetical protein
MDKFEELSKEFIKKFLDTPVIQRRCMCCGKEFSTLGSGYICSDCQLTQQRHEEEIHKRLKAAYDDGYIAGAKAAAYYILSLVNLDECYTDNYFDTSKFESIVEKRFWPGGIVNNDLDSERLL